MHRAIRGWFRCHWSGISVCSQRSTCFPIYSRHIFCSRSLRKSTCQSLNYTLGLGFSICASYMSLHRGVFPPKPQYLLSLSASSRCIPSSSLHKYSYLKNTLLSLAMCSCSPFGYFSRCQIFALRSLVTLNSSHLNFFTRCQVTRALKWVGRPSQIPQVKGKLCGVLMRCACEWTNWTWRLATKLQKKTSRKSKLLWATHPYNPTPFFFLSTICLSFFQTIFQARPSSSRQAASPVWMYGLACPRNS